MVLAASYCASILALCKAIDKRDSWQIYSEKSALIKGIFKKGRKNGAIFQKAAGWKNGACFVQIAEERYFINVHILFIHNGQRLTHTRREREVKIVGMPLLHYCDLRGSQQIVL